MVSLIKLTEKGLGKNKSPVRNYREFGLKTAFLLIMTNFDLMGGEFDSKGTREYNKFVKLKNNACTTNPRMA